MSGILYVINPAAAGGKSLGVWDQVRSLLPAPPDAADIVHTSSPGHAAEIARSTRDYEILAAVGGDGTAREILSGTMANPGSRPALAIIPAGTGNDAARAVGITSVAAGVAALRSGRTRAFDLFRVKYQSADGPAQTYGFVYCTVGFGAVSHGTVKPWMKRLLGATGAYYLGAVRALLAYEAPVMSARWGEQDYRGRTLIMFFCNAAAAGGGSMRLAPGARIDDGELNAVIVPSLSKLEVLRRLPQIAAGTHVKRRDIGYFPVTRIELDSVPAAALEIDGDAFGGTPATVSVCPGAARIVSPPGNGA